MNAHQRNVAAVLRGGFDAAHHRALTEDGVSDAVFFIQDSALHLADKYQSEDPTFDRQEFLSLAINQPGITNQWDEVR